MPIQYRVSTSITDLCEGTDLDLVNLHHRAVTCCIEESQHSLRCSVPGRLGMFGVEFKGAGEVGGKDRWWKLGTKLGQSSLEVADSFAPWKYLPSYTTPLHDQGLRPCRASPLSSVREL